MTGFRTVRWIRTANLVAQAVLFVTLCIGLNYVSFNHAWRFDLTRQHKYSLSAETKAYLETLTEPIHVAVTLSENADDARIAAALPDIRGLLREYVYATEGNVEPGRRDGRISVQYIDIYERNREASQLGLDEPNVVKFSCGDRSQVLHLEDVFRMDGAKLTEFLGEQAFTPAIIDVAKSRKRVYFMIGDGESRLEDSGPEGLSVLATALKQRNYAVETINLNDTRAIPDDASVIVAVRPRQIQPEVQEQLRQYLSSTTRSGRLVLFLEPGSNPALDGLLGDWGVALEDDVVVDNDPNERSQEGDLLVHAFVDENPITQVVRELKVVPRISRARSVRPDAAGSHAGGLKVTALAATSKSAWGEKSYLSQREPVYDPGVDYKGSLLVVPKERLGLVVASEKAPPQQNLPFSVANGRLVVFGSLDFVTNRRFDAFLGNQSLVLNAINWAAGRDAWLNIPAHSVERFQLSLSARDLTRLRYSLLLVLPGFAAALGFLVYWARRT